MFIRWTEPAARDLTEICDYIEQNSTTQTARRVAISIYDRVDSLAQFPEQGRRGRREGTRELALPGLPFIAIYQVQENTVEILRILHGAQKWP